jgi:hypothetical protein
MEFDLESSSHSLVALAALQRSLGAMEMFRDAGMLLVVRVWSSSGLSGVSSMTGNANRWNHRGMAGN